MTGRGTDDSEILPDVAAAAGPRPWRWTIVASGILALAIGVGEAAALAGLAGLLTAGDNASITSSVPFADRLANPWAVCATTAAVLLLNLLNNGVIERAVAKWCADRRDDLFTGFGAADFPYQRQQSAGSLIAVTEQIVPASRVLASDISLVGTAGRAAIYLGAAFLSSWQTALVAGASGAALMLSLRLVARRTRRLNEAVSQQSVTLGEELGDMVGSARELRQLARWPEVLDRSRAATESLRNSQYLARWVAAEVAPLFFTGILMIGLATAVWSDAKSPATLAASGMLLIRALGALQTCQLVLQQRNDAGPSYRRVLGRISDLHRHAAAAHAAESRADGPPVGAVTGSTGSAPVRTSGSIPAVEFANATLSYGDAPALTNVTTTLSGPGAIAIVGESGAGKSTMLAAAAGLMWPSAGSVSVAGRPIQSIPPAEVGSLLGLLAQDTHVIQGTVRSNLLRADVVRDDAELLAVIERVGLTSTVESFSGGLDAPLGRGSHGFSGGELQRLGLARLLVNRPPVWLLDEPTSALDRENAARVFDIVSEAREQHLVIVVTHRPELLSLCETTILVEEGKITDRGATAAMAAEHPFVAAMLRGATH